MRYHVCVFDSVSELLVRRLPVSVDVAVHGIAAGLIVDEHELRGETLIRHLTRHLLVVVGDPGARLVGSQLLIVFLNLPHVRRQGLVHARPLPVQRLLGVDSSSTVALLMRIPSACHHHPRLALVIEMEPRWLGEDRHLRGNASRPVDRRNVVRNNFEIKVGLRIAVPTVVLV